MPKIVLPAHAGMIPSGIDPKRIDAGAPRACGDDPVGYLAQTVITACSPRMRG